MKSNPSFFALVLCMLLSPLVTLSQCKEEQQKLDHLQKEYGELFAELEKQSDQLKSALPDTTGPNLPDPNLQFDVKFKSRRYAFDLIEVTMKNKSMSLDIPRVTMKMKSFSVPYSTWRWKVKWVMGVKTKWLEVTNGMKQVKTKFPEVKMDRQEIITKVPEFKKNRKEIIFNIPEFTLKTPIPEEGPIADRQKRAEAVSVLADSINVQATQLEAAQKGECKAVITALFNCIDLELETQKVESSARFAENIVEIDNAINDVKLNGGNPEAIAAEDGTSVNLIVLKADLLRAQEDTVANLSAEQAKLRDELKHVLETLEVQSQSVARSH